MLTHEVERRKNAPVADVAGGCGCGRSGADGVARKAQRGVEEVGTSMRSDWPVFAIFGIALVSLLVYGAAAVLGWFNWKAWLPIAVATLFISWISALRIRDSGRSDGSPR